MIGRMQVIITKKREMGCRVQAHKSLRREIGKCRLVGGKQEDGGSVEEEVERSVGREETSNVDGEEIA